MDMVAAPYTQEKDVIEKRRSKLSRRKGVDRRKAINPNYEGPVRRTTLDRRMKTQDRRNP